MKEKVLVLDLDYTVENDKGIVLIYGKDKNGKNVLVKDQNFYHYFYILPKNEEVVEKIEKKIKQINQAKVKTRILKVEKIKKVWENREVEVVKVTVENPRRLKDVRDVVKEWEEVENTFEYDFTLAKRYMLDKKIIPLNCIEVEGEEVEDKNFWVDRVIIAKKVRALDETFDLNFKILAFDTEFVEENGENKLIMLSLASDRTKKVITSYGWKEKPKYVEVVKSEKEIILKFMEEVKRENPDFIVGYNSDSFDFQRLRERCDKYKIKLILGRDKEPIRIVRRGRISSARIKGLIHLDLYDFVSHILAPSLKSEVLTLDEVCKELIGESKKELKYKDMVELWNKKKGLERLVEYSLWDAELTLKLAKHLVPQILAISQIANVLPFDACRNTYSQLVEAYFIRKAIEDNVLIPNRPKTEEIERRKLQPPYKGAIVIEPKKGIHSNIVVLDFRSLYPSLIVTFNIDPWTFNFSPCKNKMKVPEHNYYFCNDCPGFIPRHLKYLIDKRKELKQKLKKIKDEKEKSRLNNLQYALKIIANATYGYMAYFGARWYRRECGEAAAAFGRFYIRKVVEEAKKRKFDVIYGDTDSLMFTIPNLSKEKILEEAKKFEAEINKELPGIMEIEFRGLYEAGIFVTREKGEVGAKKRYALIDYEGNLEIRGFETVRRDWCELAKKVQREVLKTILHEKNEKKAVEIVRKVVEKLKRKEIDIEDLIIYEQITRPLSQYEQIGPHVKAAYRLRDAGIPIGEGSVIGFVIVKGGGSISDRAFPLELIKDPKEYDEEYYIRNQVVPASLRVLKALGYKEEDILAGKTSTLHAFFKKS